MTLNDCTPEQLRRVDAFLAENVMGFKKGTHYWHINPLFGNYTIEGIFDPDVPKYRPTENVAAAIELVETYCNNCPRNGQHMDYSLCKISNEYSVELECLYNSDFEFVDDWNGSGSTLPLAIVSAVLAAEGVTLAQILAPDSTSTGGVG